MDIGGDGCIDSVGAANIDVGVQLPTFFSFFFQKMREFSKKNQTEPTLGWSNLGLFILSFLHT